MRCKPEHGPHLCPNMTIAMHMKSPISSVNRLLFVICSCLCLSMFIFVTLAQANDGLTTYEAVCKRCHGSLEEQKSSLETPIIPVVMLPLGPDLKGVFGRPAGIVKGFQYSKGMKAFAKSGAIWDRTTLDLFLTDSRKLVPGTFMFIKVPESQRAPLIDYLEKVAPYRP